MQTDIMVRSRKGELMDLDQYFILSCWVIAVTGFFMAADFIGVKLFEGNEDV
tara:strand:- start:328 stop:483 length:156 start_codon:yes stop_codon:yes gene_type:complete